MRDRSSIQHGLRKRQSFAYPLSIIALSDRGDRYLTVARLRGRFHSEKMTDYLISPDPKDPRLTERVTGLEARLEEKRARRRRDESNKPLARYRDEELEKMRLNFYGFDPSYHVARYNFVYKVPRSRTPLTLASHRRTRPAGPVRNAS